MEIKINKGGEVKNVKVTARISFDMFIVELTPGDVNSTQLAKYADVVEGGDDVPVGYPDVQSEPEAAPAPLFEAADLSDSAALKKILDILSEDTMEVASDAGAVKDANGRYHAPHDGFFFEGRVYKGGEYLLEGDFRQTYEARVKMPFNQIIAAKQAGVCVRYGRDWEVNGERIAYATFIGERAKIQKIEAMFPRAGKELMLHDENDVNRGKAFKFNTRKLSSIVRGHNPEGHLDTAGFGQIPWSFVGDSVKSPWSGKMVSFKYYDGIFRL